MNQFIIFYVMFSPLIYLYFSTSSLQAKMDPEVTHKWVFRFYSASLIIILGAFLYNNGFYKEQVPCPQPMTTTAKSAINPSK